MAALKSLLPIKEDQTKLWQGFLVILGSKTSYEEKIESLFAVLDKYLRMQVYYLYLFNHGSSKFTLEHFKTAEKLIKKGQKSITEEIASDSVQFAVGSPPLEISYSENYEIKRLVSTKAGQLLSIPMRIDDGLLGLLQVGPVDDENMMRRVEQQVDKVLFPFCLAVSQARLTQNLSEKLVTIESRSDVSRKILSSAFEVNKFISLLLELSLKATGTEAGFVAIAEADSEKLVIRASENITMDFLHEVDLLPGHGLFDWLSETEKSLVVRDWEFVHRNGIKSILAVPLLANDELLGVFALANFKKEETFTDYSLRLLKDFSEQIRLVLDNARLLELFSQRYLETMKALSKSVDVRFPSTMTHSERVACTAVEIAQKMKLPPVEIQGIEIAGLIHDVGMCGVSEVARGFRADYNHPIIGADMIEFLTFQADIAGAIRTHHEWYDGWGFPKNLKGEEIPLGGRILALAEFFVESTTPGEIHKVMGWTKLSDEIARRRGSQFDPMVVDAFLKLMGEKREQAKGGPLEDCYLFQCCSEDVASQCQAFKAEKACWIYGADARGSIQLGFKRCEDCFLYKEWDERTRELGQKREIKGGKKGVRFNVREEAGVTIVDLEDNIDASCAHELRDLLKGMIDGGTRRILMNLKEVNFIDSSGLGIFVAAYKMMNQIGGAIKFAKPQKTLEKIFELTRTHKVFEIFDSIDEALKSFQS